MSEPDFKTASYEEILRFFIAEGLNIDFAELVTEKAIALAGNTQAFRAIGRRQ